MHVVLDRSGRIVVPREAREKLGLGPGSRLEVTVSEGALVLRRLFESEPLQVRDGVLVYTGQLSGDLGRAVSRDRAARRTRVMRRRAESADERHG